MSAPDTSTLDARHCRDLVRRHARTFALASHFLPADKRRAAHAIYAFCRVADDLVDVADGRSTAERATQLAALAVRLDLALHGIADDPVLREVAWAVERFQLPRGPLQALVAGVARDLEPVRYESWEQLYTYCEGVASTVGETCAHVFGLPADPAERARALGHARTLGVAMQLTNILRDVGEDARNGRCYLPAADLDHVGLTRGDVLKGRVLPGDPRWRAMMALLVGRARALYEVAAPGIAMLDPDARRCVQACSLGYAAILPSIERIGYDSLNVRATVPNATRAKLLLQVWLTPVHDTRLDGFPAPPDGVLGGRLRDTELVRIA